MTTYPDVHYRTESSTKPHTMNTRIRTGWKILIFFFPLGLVAFSILPLIPRSSPAFSSAAWLLGADGLCSERFDDGMLLRRPFSVVATADATAAEAAAVREAWALLPLHLGQM